MNKYHRAIISALIIGLGIAGIAYAQVSSPNYWTKVNGNVYPINPASSTIGTSTTNGSFNNITISGSCSGSGCGSGGGSGTSTFARSATKVVCSFGAIDTADCDYVAGATNANVAIQAAINAIAASSVGHGLVHLSEGTFTVSSSILLSSPGNLTIEGSGWGTELYLATSTNQPIFTTNSSTLFGEITIRDMHIFGNRLNQSSSDCMDMGGVYQSTFTDLWIEGCYGTGLAISGQANNGNFGYNNIVTDNLFDGNGQIGLSFYRSDESYISGNLFKTFTLYGLEDFAGLQNITGNTFEGVAATSGMGIYTASSSSNGTITDNIFDSVAAQAIDINGSSTIVSGNQFYLCSNIVTSTDCVLYQGGSGNVFTDNIVHPGGKFQYAVDEQGNSSVLMSANNLAAGSLGIYAPTQSSNDQDFFNNAGTTVPKGTAYWGQVDSLGNIGFNVPSGDTYDLNVSDTPEFSSSLVYGTSTGSLAPLTIGSNLSVSGGALNASPVSISGNGIVSNASGTLSATTTVTASSVLVSPLVAGSARIRSWGDSLTAGVNNGGFGLSYPAQLSSILGLPIDNEGIPGQTSSQIATRALANIASTTNPLPPTLTSTCASGCNTTYAYEISVNGQIMGTTAVSGYATTTNTSTLSGTNFNTITAPACPATSTQVFGVTDVQANATSATYTFNAPNNAFQNGQPITVTGLTNSQLDITTSTPIYSVLPGNSTLTVLGTFTPTSYTADSTGYITITPSYEVWRATASGTAYGAGQITLHQPCGVNLNDTGLPVLTSSTPPQANTTGMGGGFTIIWAGYNDLGSSSTIVTNVTNIVNALPSPKEYLVLGLPAGSGNLGNLSQIQTDNSALQAAFPNNFFNVLTYLNGQYNPALPQDVTDHNNGIVPTSLRSDAIHLTNIGYGLLAQQIANFINSQTDFVFPRTTLGQLRQSNEGLLTFGCTGTVGTASGTKYYPSYTGAACTSGQGYAWSVPSQITVNACTVNAFKGASSTVGDVVSLEHYTWSGINGNLTLGSNGTTPVCTIGQGNSWTQCQNFNMNTIFNRGEGIAPSILTTSANDTVQNVQIMCSYQFSGNG